MSSETVVYMLGLFLHYSLTKEKFVGHINYGSIKKVGIYQFLLAVLKYEPSQRITDVPYLLELLNKKEEKPKYKKFNMGCLYEFSTVGLMRSINQDYMKSVDYQNDIIILMIADGMGGGEDGDMQVNWLLDEYKYWKKIFR